MRASAGTGKTYSLTEELYDCLEKKLVEPERVIAVTFTRAAAGELKERVRSKLFEKGLTEEAHRVEAALIGTVHSVCESLLKRFAFETGLSPDIQVLPDDEAGACFKAALSGALTGEILTTMAEIAYRFDDDDWLKIPAGIAEKVRVNGISAGRIPAMADESVKRYLRFFPPAMKITAEIADTELEKILKKAIGEIEGNIKSEIDTTKKTKDYLKGLRITYHQRKRLKWKDRAKLASNKPGMKSLEAAGPVIAAGAEQFAHPLLRQDIETFIRTVFAVAAEALERYDHWKRERGFIDFTDMEAKTAFDLLQNQSVIDSLEKEFDLLMVDEFQDTSPIQLALFNRLGEITGNVIWVGDKKQSIYKFRGCDPDLMEQAYAALEKGTEEKVLPDCYRSRKPLVDFCSAIFKTAFVPLGYREKEFTLGAPRGEPAGLPPPIEVWALDGKNARQVTNLLAEGIRQLLDPGEEITIIDKISARPRPIRAGDIAILRRTNLACENTATALNRIGIRASVAQQGLTKTREGVYLLSALEVVLDRTAGVPALIVRCLSRGESPADYIDEQIALKKGDGSPGIFPWDDDPLLRNLRALDGELITSSPSEMLDRVIETSGAREVCLRWPQSGPKLANIEMLRMYAGRYEETCRFRQTGASTLGLLLYLKALSGLAEGDRQSAEEYEDAVTISTYHRAKGREWPVVVVGDLEKRGRGGCLCCGAHIVSGDEEFDLANPLKDRWIRYWPWPYGNLTKGAPLYEELKASPEEDLAVLRETREMQRLLYVGFTRARDILILPARKNQSEPNWLKSLEAGVSLPIDDDEGEAIRHFGSGGNLRSRLRRLTQPGDQRAALLHSSRWFARPEGEPPERDPLFISPSSLKVKKDGDSEVPAREGTSIDLGDPIKAKAPKEAEDSPFGNAVHAFFAADRKGLTEDKRIEIARRCLASFGVVSAVTPDDLLTAADRLYKYCEEEWPGGKLWRELPVESVQGEQIVKGIADLVIETNDAVHLIDHKTIAAKKDRCPFIANLYQPQLQAYAAALEKALSKPCKTTAIHFPFAGLVITTVPGS
ncbi:MAG: UvrD-helicase domain-containing protein [Candidatus Auribacterota bacterium]|nr:UvrD-helicase domain-containing protein [Candidatus Auribacterota bacterium]